jgi:SPP1 family predicted phage head-tail adaptor
MLSLPAGRLRHRIEIQNYEMTQDDWGQPIYTWTHWADVWASVEPLQGREFLAAMALQSQTTVRIRMRYRPGVTSQMRVLFDGRIYSIDSVIEPQSRRHALQLMCKTSLATP